jgi:Cu-Zn family superoxide dismutase
MQGFKRLLLVLLSLGASVAAASQSESLTIPIRMVAANGVGKEIGEIVLLDQACGVLITPKLHHLKPGAHGFHIHEKPDCSDNGLAAGGHFDPAKTNAHHGPYAMHGHQGDMPILVVDKDGTATLPTLAPHLSTAMVRGHAIMIHENGDNYSDKPEKLGGGGARIACGVIPPQS